MLSLGTALLLAPAVARTDEARHQREDIRITRDGQFDRDHGVRSGRGTLRSPYVISGWTVNSIEIKDTTKAVRIENNSVHGQLTLNWSGKNVIVRNNDIGDLRVNENIPRWGAPTGGLIEENTFGVVGQLRHFDGMFMHNVVGSPESSLQFWSNRAVNFDGFNGAHFAYNTIYGYMDARLHGHHHSSGFGEHSHMHAGKGYGMVNHSKRWHEVFIHHNRIVTRNWYALAYLDTNHDANDRTAASETNPELNAPHMHFTRAHIFSNRLEGAGIRIDVFNAKDELHTRFPIGLMRIAGNRITLERGPFYPFEARNGIEVVQAQGLALDILNNSVTAPAPQKTGITWLDIWQAQGSGVQLYDLHRATVRIFRNTVVNQHYGIQASQFTNRVHWSIRSLTTKGVTEPVYYDQSVENEPN